MNKSLKAAISVCVISTVLFVVGFALVYSLDYPNRLQWCTNPTILNCTTEPNNIGSSNRSQHRYIDTYIVNYTIQHCVITRTVQINSSQQCEFALGGRSIDNGIVCYITPDCKFDTYKAKVIVTIMVLSSTFTAVAFMSFIAVLILRFVPYLYKHPRRKSVNLSV
jgi:hypothetical protein